jgi:hypothetical protein
MSNVDRSGRLHGFLAASLLTFALLLPHSRVLPISAGIALAALLRATWRHWRALKPSSPAGKDWRRGAPPPT